MSDPHAHATTPAEFAASEDVQLDPHGFGAGHHHGHVILSSFSLRAVLSVLLVLTGLTVFCALGEQWASLTFDFIFPRWVNVAVAMSIAVVKALIVAAVFMQLKYDNPINSMIMLFCLFALALFLGFTSLDVCFRDRVEAFKAGDIVLGGTGASHLSRSAMVDGKRVTVTVTKPITTFAREGALERLGPEEFARQEAEAHAHGHHAHAESPWSTSTNRSRPRTGFTPALFDDAPAAGEHGHGDAPASAGHAPERH